MLLKTPPIFRPNLILLPRRPASSFPNRGRINPHRAPTSSRASYFRRTSPAFRTTIAVGGAATVGFVAWNTERVPISGRLRFNCVPESMERHMGQLWHKQILEIYGGHLLPVHHPYSRMVDEVMDRLVPVSGLEGQQWEAVVIDDRSERNAFVIPGGKIFVFSGLMPICEDTDGLAAILGHEIAHNIAHHAGEEMSMRWVLFSIGLAVSVVFNISHQLIDKLLDIGYSKPGSRKQESEADYIGLMIMARACYNPEAAVAVNQRMMEAEQDQTLQFLSTHPSGKDRVKKMQEWLVKAMQEQAQSPCEATMHYFDDFNMALQTSKTVRTQLP